MTRVPCVRPHRVILIHLLLNSLSKMTTFQKPVVRLTLCTPTELACPSPWCLKPLPQGPTVFPHSLTKRQVPCFEAPHPRQLPGTAKTMQPRDKGEVTQPPPRSTWKRGQRRPFRTGNAEVKAPASGKSCRWAEAPVCLRRAGFRELFGETQTASGQRLPLQRPRSISLLCWGASFRRETCRAWAGSTACGATPASTSGTSAFLEVN